MNNDLISRSALILEFCDCPDYSASMFKKIRRRINAAPAVDAVEVVRCRDCVHDGLSTCFTCYIEQHKMIFLNHDPEFFCGAGERKDADDGNEA